MKIVVRSLLAFAGLEAALLLAPSVLSSPTKGPTPESCLACSDSHEAKACHAIAIELAEIRDFGRAIAIEERALALDPRNPEMAAALAKMYQIGTRDSVRAIKLYHEALYSQPGYPPALLGLGQIMKDSGETEIAERYFMRGVKENPDQPLFKVKLAEVMVESGRSEKAKPILDEVLARWPGSGEADAARKLMSRTTLARQ